MNISIVNYSFNTINIKINNMNVCLNHAFYKFNLRHFTTNFMRFTTNLTLYFFVNPNIFFFENIVKPVICSSNAVYVSRYRSM